MSDMYSYSRLNWLNDYVCCVRALIAVRKALTRRHIVAGENRRNTGEQTEGNETAEKRTGKC